MRLNAWKTGTLTAVGVLVLLLATSAYAQTSTRFSIPFQFLAGDQTLPAGQYLVRVDQATHSVILQQVSGTSVTTLRFFGGKRSLDRVEEGKLLFKAYGSARVLARVWTRGVSDASDLPVSKAERELARSERAGSMIEIALAAPR